MRRTAALIWLALVCLSAGYVCYQAVNGITLRTDLTALLPRDERDPVLQKVNDAVSSALSRRAVFLIGHTERAKARAGAASISKVLAASGAFAIEQGSLDAERLKRVGALYWPHRDALLSDADRATLQAGHGEAVAARALAQAYGFVGLSDSRLLTEDPFLLFPAFMARLPFPMSRLSVDDGMLTAQSQGKTWILVTGLVSGDPYDLAVQEAAVRAHDSAVAGAQAQTPGLEAKHLGAVFFAFQAARSSLHESRALAFAATAGTILLVICVFHRLSVLWLNLLAVGTGLLVGLAASLATFGEIHVASLLFGTSLIGIAVDYALQYSVGFFDADALGPERRLSHVLSGISLGLLCTLIGYIALMLAPFPGLRQIAVFSAIGLGAAFASVVLWFPLLDRTPTLHHGRPVLGAMAALWRIWETRTGRRVVAAILVVLAVAGTVGLMRLRANDDVRSMQSLSKPLLREQEEVRDVIGATVSPQFILVRADGDDAALRTEEALAARLAPLVAEGALSGFQTPAAFIPSAERQTENRRLIRDQLKTPFLDRQRTALGLAPAAPRGQRDDTTALTLNDAASSGAIPFLSQLIIAPGIHVVMLEGLTDADAVRSAVSSLPGVRLVDPTGDFSALLSKYRRQALWQLALTAALVAPVLLWRYGWRRGVLVLVPSAAAVVLTPALLALAGQAMTFFHAMALILVLAIGVDYAVFCAESSRPRRPLTMLAILLAAVSTMLSFGLLAFSRAHAVHAFGLTMLIGITLAFLLAPLAATGRAGKA